MDDFYHGIRAQEQATALPVPSTVTSGISFLVGTAPVHAASGTVNEPILASTYAEALAAFGYSDDWKSYDICEMMDCHFKRYKMSPVVFVNVLNPETHKKTVAAAQMSLSAGQLALPLEAIAAKVNVQSADGSSDYTAEVDYSLFYEGDALILERLDGGAIAANDTLLVSYDAVDPTAVSKADIIGGYHVASPSYTGLEVIDMVFPKYRIEPDIILAPNWSGNAEVAAVMAAKAENINGLFKAKALIDADSASITNYTDVEAWKNSNEMTAVTQIVLWPQVAQSGRRYRLSTQMASLMAKVDNANNAIPSDSPSNYVLEADSIVLGDGTEIYLDLPKAIALNKAGIVTALNSVSGFVLYGNYTACWPTNTDIKDHFISVSRMFAWEAKQLILNYWSKVDRRMNRLLVDSVLNEENQRLSALATMGHLLGGRIEYLDSENTLDDMLAGIIRFHIYMTPPLPAQEIDFIQEYDLTYLEAAFA